jgi:hypothetical protein
LSQAFRIETLDRSGRWYLTPGARSIYDLRIRNDSKNAVECSLVVDEPATGVTVEPAVFSMRGHDVRAVTVTFAPDATIGRAHAARLSLRSENDGSMLATFEHPLVITGGTDCSVAMAWKDVIVEAGELRGFQVACSVRSQSESTSTFQVSLSQHPALSVPALPPISLEPGQLGEMVIPIQWNRSVKDETGWNHPLIIEAAVPVSNGRRTSRMRWESIELALEPFLKSSAQKMNVTVSTGPHAGEPAPVAQKPPVVSATIETQATPAGVDKQAHAPAAAAKQAPAVPAIEQRPAAQATMPAMLMLNGHTQLLMLAAPLNVKETARPAATPPAAASRPADAAVAAPPAAPAMDAVELPLFPEMAATSPVAAGVNGKLAVAPSEIAHPPVATPPPATPTQPPASSGASAAPVQRAPTSTQSPSATNDTSSRAATVAPPDEKAQARPGVADTAAAAAPASAQPASAPPASTPAEQTPTTPTLTWTVRSGNAEEPTAKTLGSKPAAAASERASQAGASSPTTPPASQRNPTSPASAAPPAKLTPYAPARWNEDSGEHVRVAAISQPAAITAIESTSQTAAAPTPPPAAVPVQVRTRATQAAAHKPGPKLAQGLVLGGLAGGALLVAGLLIFKPMVTTGPSSKPVAVQPAAITPVVRVQQHAAPVAVRHATHTAKPVLAVAPTRPPTATPAPTPTVKVAATPKPAPTTGSATPRPAAKRVVAARPAPQKPVSHYARLYQPESGTVVALGSVEAFYGPRGRVVRVLWGAAEQASAVVQLIDEHGSTVSATSVRGGRSSALLYLPRGFRGPLTVQVSSIGRMGERVATTTSLPAFGQ